MPPVHKPLPTSNPAPTDSPSVSVTSTQSRNFSDRNLFFFKKRVILQGPIAHTYSDLVEALASKDFKESTQPDFYKWLVEQEPKFSSLDMNMLKETAILSFHRLKVSLNKFGSTTKKDDTKRPEEVIAAQTEVTYAVRDYKGSLNLLYELLLLKRISDLEHLLVNDENQIRPLSAECNYLCKQSLQKAIEFRLQDFYWETGETKRKEEMVDILVRLPPEVRADPVKFREEALKALAPISLELEGRGYLARHSDPTKSELDIPPPIPFPTRYTDLVNITYKQNGEMFERIRKAIGWTDDDLAKINNLSPKEREVFNVHLALASYSYDLTKYFAMLYATALDESRLKGEPTSYQVQKITGKTRYPKFAPARYDVREKITQITDSLRDLPRIFEKLNLIIANPARDKLARLISQANVGRFKRLIHWYIDIGDTRTGKALNVVAKASVLLEVVSGMAGILKWRAIPEFLDFFRGDLEQVVGIGLFVLIMTSAPRWVLKAADKLARRISRI
jgi:hypothetical protein